MSNSGKVLHLTESEFGIVASPFFEIKDAVDWTPENKPIQDMIEQCLKIISSKGVPIGGSAVTNEHIKELLSRIPSTDNEKETQTT